MAAVPLFRSTDMADVTSSENTLFANFLIIFTFPGWRGNWGEFFFINEMKSVETSNKAGN